MSGCTGCSCCLTRDPHIRTLLEGFDRGVFVRSIKDDNQPGWALKLLPYINAIGALARAMDEAQAESPAERRS